MQLNLNNKNVLITGASRGIGLAIANSFINEGSKVISISRNSLNVEDSKKNIEERFWHVKADVTKADDFQIIQESVIRNFNGKIDVLICNVGSGKSVKPGDESLDEWMRSFNINFFSTTNTIELLGKYLRKDSNIICISSICGLEALGAPLTYSAAKAALNSYVVGASKVFGKKEIRINAVAPGNILFKGSTWEEKLQKNPQGVKEMLEKEVALGELGSVEDVAYTVLFLASERAKFITGSIIVVDGGQVRS